MEPKKIDVTPEMLEKSLRCCAEENPAPAGHEPCEDCYLWQLHLVKGGRVSTGETCFQNLVGEAFACVRRLNDFDQSQSKILLEKLEQAKAENGQLKKESEQNLTYVEAYKQLLAKSMELNHKLLKQRAKS